MCRMDITLDHFKRGVTKDLLQGIDVSAVFQITGGKDCCISCFWRRISRRGSFIGCRRENGCCWRPFARRNWRGEISLDFRIPIGYNYGMQRKWSIEKDGQTNRRAQAGADCDSFWWKDAGGSRPLLQAGGRQPGRRGPAGGGETGEGSKWAILFWETD